MGKKHVNEIPVHLTGRLESFWMEGHYFDTTVEVEGEVFKVHRLVLAAMSDYFHTMLSGGFKESTENKIRLNGIKKAGFAVFVNLAYKHKAGLTKDNVLDALDVAEMTLCVPLQKRCLSFIEKSYLTEENFIDTVRLALGVKYKGLMNVLAHYWLKEFRNLETDLNFYSLTKEEIIVFLEEARSSFTDLDMFTISREWLLGNGLWKAPMELMQFVQFENMSLDQLALISGDALLRGDKELAKIMETCMKTLTNDCSRIQLTDNPDNPTFALCYKERRIFKLYDIENDEEGRKEEYLDLPDGVNIGTNAKPLL